MKAILFGSLSIFSGMALSLFIAEGMVRIYKADVAYQPDPKFIRSLRPHVVNKIYSRDTPEALERASNSPYSSLSIAPSFIGSDYTNNIGLRMREDVGPKAAAERRILLLGDSYTEANGLPEEQRYPSIVEAHLQVTQDKGRWKVLNGAIQNGAPSQYILQLNRYLPIIQPDIVIVALAPNDLDDDVLFERRYGFLTDNDGFPLAPKTQVQLWLLQQSWALRYFEVFLFKWLPALHDYVFTFSNGSIQPLPWHRQYCRPDREARELFRLKTGRYILRLKQMAESKNIKFGVLLIHYMTAFHNEPFDLWYPGVKEDLRQWECTPHNAILYNEFIESFFEQHGIRYQNTFEAMLRAKKESPSRKLWGYFDYHYSPHGHQVVSEELLKLVNTIGQP